MTGRISRFALAVVLLTIAAVPGIAAENPDWEFSAGLYGWLPTISGTLAYDLPGLGQTIEIDPETLIDNLSFTIQGGFDVKRGKWGFMADMIYLQEKVTKDNTIDIGEGVSQQADYTLDSWIVNFGFGYELLRDPRGTTFGVLAGARYFSMDSSLRLTSDGPAGLDTTVESNASLWNGFIGVDGRIALGKSWYIPYYLDVGAGASDLTWQGLAGINYEWHWGGLALSYRYLEFDQGDGSPVKKMSMNGPELGIYFNF